MNKKVFLIIVILLLLVGCGKKEETKEIESGKITCKQKKELMARDEKPILIDVRTKEEFEEKHLDEAINIPYETVVDGVGAMENIGFDTPIIVYCKSGNRSGQAYNSLKMAGYKNVYDLGAMSNCS